MLTNVCTSVCTHVYTHVSTQAILTGLMPPGGPTTGGTTVTISGVNFADSLGQVHGRSHVCTHVCSELSANVCAHVHTRVCTQGKTSLDGNTVKIVSAATQQTTIVQVSLLIDHNYIDHNYIVQVSLLIDTATMLVTMPSLTAERIYPFYRSTAIYQRQTPKGARSACRYEYRHLYRHRGEERPAA